MVLGGIINLLMVDFTGKTELKDASYTSQESQIHHANVPTELAGKLADAFIPLN